MTDQNVRSRVTRELLAVPGADLIFVKVSHNPIHLEVVYNEPDIDTAPVVWARRVGPEPDRRLVAHLRDRVVWEFEWRPDTAAGYRLRRLETALPLDGNHHGKPAGPLVPGPGAQRRSG
jgi:hypothetical protein